MTDELSLLGKSVLVPLRAPLPPARGAADARSVLVDLSRDVLLDERMR